MTNREETYEQYKSVCKLNKKEPNQLIIDIFENKTQSEASYK